MTPALLGLFYENIPQNHKNNSRQQAEYCDVF
jgi:hypothetical protein